MNKPTIISFRPYCSEYHQVPLGDMSVHNRRAAAASLADTLLWRGQDVPDQGEALCHYCYFNFQLLLPYYSHEGVSLSLICLCSMHSCASKWFFVKTCRLTNDGTEWENCFFISGVANTTMSVRKDDKSYINCHEHKYASTEHTILNPWSVWF